VCEEMQLRVSFMLTDVAVSGVTSTNIKPQDLYTLLGTIFGVAFLVLVIVIVLIIVYKKRRRNNGSKSKTRCKMRRLLQVHT